MSIQAYLRPRRPQGHPQHHRRRPTSSNARITSRARSCYPFRDQGVHLIGFPGCFPNAYAHRMMERLCTHPNVGGVLLVSLGCEGFNKGKLLRDDPAVRTAGRSSLVIQDTGGTRKTIAEGQAWVEQTLAATREHAARAMGIDELVVGTICGGSDATSGLTANPAMGRAFDLLVEQDATCIFEETGELIGMEHLMAERAAKPVLGEEIVKHRSPRPRSTTRRTGPRAASRPATPTAA